MSAPRKIWATEYDEVGAKGAGHWVDHNFSVDAVAYHHDDVVRELVAALEEIRSIDRIFMDGDEDSDCPSDRFKVLVPFGYGPLGKIADAAIAKIAQEG